MSILKHIHWSDKWYHICSTHYTVQAESTHWNAARNHAFYRNALEEHTTTSTAVKQQNLSAKRKLYYFSQEPEGTSNNRLIFCVRKKKHDSYEKKPTIQMITLTRRSKRLNLQNNLIHIWPRGWVKEQSVSNPKV